MSPQNLPRDPLLESLRLRLAGLQDQEVQARLGDDGPVNTRPTPNSVGGHFPEFYGVKDVLEGVGPGARSAAHIGGHEPRFAALLENPQVHPGEVFKLLEGCELFGNVKRPPR